jgi:hypothetical protein
MKKRTWLGDSRAHIRAFPARVKDDMGQAYAWFRRRGLDLRGSCLSKEVQGQDRDTAEELVMAGLVVRIERVIRQRKLSRVAAAETWVSIRRRRAALLSFVWRRQRSSVIQAMAKT